MAEKVAAGWVYGEVKDPDAKPPTHPCIVPFEELPPEQQFKDVLFKTIVAGSADIVAEAEARADKAEAATKRVKAKVTAAETPAKPRKLGRPKNPADIDRDKLKAAIADAETVEVAFSDGRTEIAGMPPLSIEGDAWRDHHLGQMLREPVTVTGPAGGSSVTIAGYALLLDGEQVAYTERSDRLAIAPGQKINLADDIYFG
jgi:hypothetical protein